MLLYQYVSISRGGVFGRKKKKVREAKIITRTMKGMTIVGFFFFFFFFRAVPYECLFFL